MIAEASGVGADSDPITSSAGTGVPVKVTLPLADSRWPRLSQSFPNVMPSAFAGTAASSRSPDQKAAVSVVYVAAAP